MKLVTTHDVGKEKATTCTLYVKSWRVMPCSKWHAVTGQRSKTIDGRGRKTKFRKPKVNAKGK